ncbi:MAG: hypothetical protein EPO37_07685 [Nitrosarchaeum sp.]|nr:MAG: hypothetical protein EPO37_07685 [Nitrosarchaeum sp.]
MSESDFRKRNIDIFLNNHVLVIITIILSSLLLRLYFFPFKVPLILDSFGYFWYASDISLLGKLPEGYTFANNGWPVVLGSFFSLLKLNGMSSYMELQRGISVIISVLTVIPVYFLCRRFVDYKFAIIGAVIFAFEPRLIQDSLSGLNNSLYIALEAIALVLFFSSNKYARYCSFALIGFASLVRSEGLFLFFALSIMYFLNHRKNKKEVTKYAVLFLIFFIIITPMAILRIQTTGSDALTSRIIGSTSEIMTSSAGNQGIFDYIINGSVTFIKFLGWDMLPIFILFVPVGIFLIFQNRNFERNTIILTLIISSIPTFYAYSAQALDTKYFYYHYPVFCVLSVLAIRKYQEFISKQKLLLIIILIGIVFGSFVFLEVKLIDVNHQKEASIVAQYVVDNAKGINNYYPEVAYVFPIEVDKKWPILKSSFKTELSVSRTESFDSLKEFIAFSKDNELTHIVADDNNKTPEFIKDAFFHPEKYPYLNLVFDYQKNGFTSYHVKVYEINYEKFNEQ